MIHNKRIIINHGGPAIKTHTRVIKARHGRQLSNGSRTNLRTGTPPLLSVIEGIKILIRRTTGTVTRVVAGRTMAIELNRKLGNVASIPSVIAKGDLLSNDLGTVTHSLTRDLNFKHKNTSRGHPDIVTGPAISGNSHVSKSSVTVTRSRIKIKGAISRNVISQYTGNSKRPTMALGNQNTTVRTSGLLHRLVRLGDQGTKTRRNSGITRHRLE